MSTVSVIIPTYNREKYISQAIKSVIEQTFSDVQIIVVDDGSTDNTKKVIESFGNRIKYIYTRNAGPAHARNIGIKNAECEYISFLDSDDLYYPWKLEIQKHILDKYKELGMVYSEFSAFSDNGYYDEYHLKKYHKSAYSNDRITYENIFTNSFNLENSCLKKTEWKDRKIYIGKIFDMYVQHIIVFTNSIMLRRSILSDVGLLNEKYYLFDDMDFALRITKRYPVCFIDVPTYKLRYHGDQISGTYQKTDIAVTIEKQENLLEIIEKIAKNDSDYYTNNVNMINVRMAALHKAIAIPLMAKGNRPKEARVHLEKCKLFGKKYTALKMITFCPYIIRRLIIKFLSILKLV